MCKVVNLELRIGKSVIDYDTIEYKPIFKNIKANILRISYDLIYNRFININGKRCNNKKVIYEKSFLDSGKIFKKELYETLEILHNSKIIKFKS